MSQCTIQATAEELFMGDYSADAEISVTFDMCPPERATRDYPGHPGTVEVVEWEIDEYSVYNPEGDLVVHSTPRVFRVGAVETKQTRTSFKLGTPQWVRDEVAKWVDKNDEYLTELACEAEAAKAEDWRY
jgi:hypothetical protein